MKLKLLQLSDLTMNPSECPADKEKLGKKNTEHQEHMFPSAKHCISFDYLHNTMQRNISKCLDVCRGLFTSEVISLHISSQSSFGVCNPRQNYVIQFVICFDLVFGGWQSYYKSYKLARKWTMLTDSYLLSVTLLTGEYTTDSYYKR